MMKIPTIAAVFVEPTGFGWDEQNCVSWNYQQGGEKIHDCLDPNWRSMPLNCRLGNPESGSVVIPNRCGVNIYIFDNRGYHKENIL